MNSQTMRVIGHVGPKQVRSDAPLWMALGLPADPGGFFILDVQEKDSWTVTQTEEGGTHEHS
jgi:hypothetical protein